MLHTASGSPARVRTWSAASDIADMQPFHGAGEVEGSCCPVVLLVRRVTAEEETEAGSRRECSRRSRETSPLFVFLLS